VQVARGVVIPTDRQTQDHVLCGVCEDILNKRGEGWVVTKLASFDRTFPLYDLLTKCPPYLSEDGLEAYLAAHNPEIDVEKLVHFAMGIFWKAAVHPWSGTDREPRIELGPYAEEIRKWLRGEGLWPQNITLTMAVSRPERAQITMNDPYRGVSDSVSRIYFMHVLGVLFVLNIGKKIPPHMKALCLKHNIDAPIIVSDDLTNKIEHLFASMYRKSRKTAAFLRAKERRNRESRRMR
jgi:hypothetical protein